MYLEFEVMSHGGTERTEDYQNLAMEVMEAPSVHGATEIISFDSQAQKPLQTLEKSLHITV